MRFFLYLFILQFKYDGYRVGSSQESIETAKK